MKICWKNKLMMTFLIIYLSPETPGLYLSLTFSVRYLCIVFPFSALTVPHGSVSLFCSTIIWAAFQMKPHTWQQSLGPLPLNTVSYRLPVFPSLVRRVCIFVENISDSKESLKTFLWIYIFHKQCIHDTELFHCPS